MFSAKPVVKQGRKATGLLYTEDSRVAHSVLNVLLLKLHVNALLREISFPPDSLVLLIDRYTSY